MCLFVDVACLLFIAWFFVCVFVCLLVCLFACSSNCPDQTQLYFANSKASRPGDIDIVCVATGHPDLYKLVNLIWGPVPCGLGSPGAYSLRTQICGLS